MKTNWTSCPICLLLALCLPSAANAGAEEFGDPAVAVHLTNGGLASLGDAVEGLLPSSIVMEDGTGEYACSEDEGDVLTFELAGLELLLSADEVALTAADGRLDLNLYGTLNSTEGTLTVAGNCSVFEDLADTCAVQLPTTSFEGQMAILMYAEDGAISASAEGPTITISPIGNPLSGEDCSLDSAVGTLLGQNEMAITDMILDAIGGSLDDVGADLSDSLADALSGLVVDTSFATGDSEVGILLEPAVVELSASGLILGLASNISPAEVSDCVDITNADDIAPSEWPVFSETADGSTLEYDIGLFIGKSFMDTLLQEIWAGGGLCVDLADLSGVPLGTSLMSGFIGEDFATLFPENEPSLFEVRPPLPPYTVFDDDGAPIRAQIDDMGLGYWAALDHRMTGIFEVGVTLEAGLDIVIGTEELTTGLVLDPALMSFEENWTELLQPGYSEGLAENLPSLIGSFIPEDTFPSMSIPEILGIEIDTVIWQPTTDDEWQAGYILLDTSGVEALEISGCGLDALGCGGESTGIEFDLGEALGCSSDDALGCEEATSDCGGGCSVSGRWPIPVSRVGLLGLLALGVVRRRR